MKNPVFLFWINLLLFSFSAQAQTPNFSENIASILYNNCTTCHRQGGIGPFPLESYNDAYINQYSIQTAVANKVMPPWPPDPSFQRYAHERFLPQSDIDMISDWVNNGALRGDSTLAPSAPVFSNGSALGIPDLKLRIPTYTSPAITQDMYRCFVVSTGHAQQEYISALDVVPGNSGIVHHVLVYEDNTGVAKTMDGQDGYPGYTCFGGTGVNNTKLLGGWVPGTVPDFYPSGMGVKLNASSDLVVQVHYPAGSNGQQDSTELNLFFVPGGSVREISLSPILNHGNTLINGPLYIPANTVKTFNAEYNLNKDISVIQVAPHMHLLGKSIRSYAVEPIGDTIPFIRINDWDFHWQGFYSFQKVLKVPSGSKLYAEAIYDNTINNLENPNNPPQDVSVGESTTDEMMLVYFAYLNYLPGDENIIIDSTLLITSVRDQIQKNNTLLLSPNPAKDKTYALFYTNKSVYGKLNLYDRMGRVVLQPDGYRLDAGYNSLPIDITGLVPGVYFVRLETEGTTSSVKLMVGN